MAHFWGVGGGGCCSGVVVGGEALGDVSYRRADEICLNALVDEVSVWMFLESRVG